MHVRRTMSVDATAVATAGPWIPTNVCQSPFNVSIAGVIGSAGSGTFRFEHTFDDISHGEAATAFVHTDLSAKSVNADGNYAFPVLAIRFVAVSVASAMTMKYLINQASN